jgi:AcrR family transcriptional regulator
VAQKRLLARRLHIVESAVACFIDNGYHQTGVRDIAARAGVSIGNLYNHFKSKDEILLEITRIEAAELSGFAAMFLGKGEAENILNHFLRDYLMYCSVAENGLLALEILSVAIRNPLVQAGFQQNRLALLAGLTGLLWQIQPGTQESTEEKAAIMLDMIEGLALRCVMAGTAPTDSQQKTLRDAVNAML